MRGAPGLAPLAALLLLAGCVTEVDFARAELPVAPLRAAPGPLAITVEDARSDVAAGERPANWAGVSRITMGIPRQVRTRSGAPLAFEVREAWLASCARAELDTAAEGDAARTLALAIERWRSDGYFGEVTVDYALGLELRDGAGEPLASGRVVGERVEHYMGDAGYGEACRRVLRVALEDLLASPELAAALGAAPPDDAPTATPASPPAPQVTSAPPPCARCGAELTLAWRHCPMCGAPVGAR